MLERTAGCLESGTLRRLLPASRNPTKSRRTLHSGFWTHGAVDLELSPLWTALVRASEPAERQEEARLQQRSPAVPSTMLLDFLYPAGTLNFLRTYSGWWADRQDGRFARGGLGKIGHRKYTSSATDASSNERALEPKPTGDLSSRYHAEASMEFLHEKLGLTKSYDYEEAWRQYMQLEGVEQKPLRKTLIYYLRNSDRIVDAERTTELFEVLEEEQKDADAHRWTIRAYLKLRNLSDAMRLHASGLETLDVPAGSEELLAHLVKSSSWSRALSVWKQARDFNIKTPSSKSYDLYTVLGTMPNLSTFAKDLADFANRRIEATPDDPSDNTLTRTFATEIIRRAVVRREGFNSTNFLALLHVLQKWQVDYKNLYEEAFEMLVSLNEKKLVVQCYRKARRAEHAKFTRYTLVDVLKIFCENHSVSGMKQVLDDFFKMYGAPSRSAYKMCMNEFASQGDAQTVHALFDQYIGRFSEEQRAGKSTLSADDLSPILQVHAKRGELSEVIGSFNRIESEFGLQPTILCWNILINAYGKVHDFDKAFATFSKVLSNPSLKPDDYTFGTILGICTARGDTELCLEVYDLALSLDITPTAAMLDAVVYSYCQDDELKKAEELCEEALTMKLKGRRTRMWNYLLVAHAMRHDLHNVNRVLQRMIEAKVDYDQYTYSALMQALCMVKQPHRAYSILQTVMPKAGISATNFHYAIIMGGFIATGELHKVLHVHRRFMRRGMSKSASIDIMLLKALVEDAQGSRDQQTDEVNLEQAMEMFQGVLKSRDAQEISSTSRKGAQNIPVDIAYPAMFYGYIMFILGQNARFKTVDEFYQAFKSLLANSHQVEPPPNILSAFMASKLREQEHDAIRECWDLALSKAKKAGAPLHLSIEPVQLKGDDSTKRPSSVKLVQKEGLLASSGNKILPAAQLALRKHLNFYMQSLFRQGKGSDIVKTVENLLSEGFELDGRNWNLYISLVSRFNMRLAFQLCETKLMPGWTGWARLRRELPERNRLSLEIRRMRKQPRHLRPHYHTLLWLARAYLKIEANATEDRRAEVMMEWVAHECPKTVGALQTMQRMDEFPEKAILHYY
jgi:pentatricopeptide repeat-containing protein PET309